MHRRPTRHRRALSWRNSRRKLSAGGKIDPGNLPACVVCYLDSARSPCRLITAYALTKARPSKTQKPLRPPRRTTHCDQGAPNISSTAQSRKIAHRTDVSDVKDFGTATTKEKPRRNLAKRASSVDQVSNCRALA